MVGAGDLLKGGGDVRGKKYDTETKERALAALAVSNNIDELSREMGIPSNTLRQWKKDAEKSEDFIELRKEKRAEFVERAWETIGNALKLADRRIKNALENGEELPLRELSTYIGTMYDKAALASGEETERAEVRITMSGELEDYAK